MSTQNYPFNSGQGFTGVTAKTGNYLLTPADNGLVFTFNGSSLTAQLPAAAPAQVWFAVIVNLNASALTVDRNGRTLNGAAANLTLAQYAAVVIWSDGVNYAYDAGGSGGGGGSTWYEGSGVPSGGTGVNGDFYLRTSNGDVYQKVSGSWGSPIMNLTGPAGANGTNGTNAIIGVTVKTGDYTLLSGDTATLFVMNSGSAHTFQLPGTVPANGWHVWLQNEGAGTCTVDRNGYNIDDAATNLSLTTGQGVLVASNGTNYYTCRGMATGGGGGGTLAGLSDVSITSPSNGQVLTYDSGTSLWKNQAGGGGGSAARTTASISQTLASMATHTGAVSMAKTFTLMKIVSTFACRLRLYSTTAARDSDLARPPETALQSAVQSQCICDIVLNGITGLTWVLAPPAVGCNLETSPSSNIAYSLTNLDLATQTVAVTLTYLPEET